MLENLKLMLGIDIDNTDKDPLLKQLIALATARLKGLLGGIEPPESLDYIVLEVTIKRYNRIGSEGLSSHSVEGESLSFSNDDFAEFTEDVKAFLASQKEAKKGKVRFI